MPTEGATTFRDELRGDVTFDHSNVDDQVLLKSDGFPTYHLANVVDDHLMHISDVIRAEEWISSTPKHVLLYQAFGWELPRFWHMPLLRNADKSKISKRKNPVSLNFYRDSGFLPQALLNYLGLMGGGMAQPSEQEIVSKGLDMKLSDMFSLDDMRQRYDFSRISLGGPVFDLVKLKWLNGEYIRKQTPEQFYAALRENVFSDRYLQAIAPLVQTRIDTLGSIGDMADFFFRDTVMPPESVWLPKKRSTEETLLFAGELLTTLEGVTQWESAAIEGAMKQLGEAKGWSVKENFMLLRAVITGSVQSPPLMESLVVFGKARSLDRVRRFVETQKRPGKK